MGKSGLGDQRMKNGEDWVQESQAGQCLTKKGEFLDKTEYSNLFLYFSPFFFFFPFSVALGKEFSLVMPMALLLGISWKT